MPQHSIINNKKVYLDKQVWLVMLGTSLICIGLLSYKFISKAPCSAFTVDKQGLTAGADSVFEVGEPVFFRTSLGSDKEITWDFGDNSEIQKSRGVVVKHTYIKEGAYSVFVSAKGACLDGDIRINIKKVEGSEKSTSKAPKIIGNASPKAGHSSVYVSDFIGGSDYEWKILDKSTFPTINNQSATFIFPKAGLYRIQLTVDHDRNNKRAIFEVNVTENPTLIQPKIDPGVIVMPIIPRKPKTEPGVKNADTSKVKPPETKTMVGEAQPNPQPTNPVLTPVVKNKQIGNRGFKTMLQSVVSGETRLEEFDEFLFQKGNTLVKVNDENGLKTFSEFFNRIKGKKYKIEDAKLIRDPNDQTIVTRIEVQIKDNRSFFNKVLHKNQ